MLEDEKILLNALREGSTAAFKLLYDHYSPLVFRKLVKMIKHTPLAEELTQDVFVKIWDKRAVIDNEKHFSYYILTIANNTVTDLYRKASRDKRLEEMIISSSVDVYNPVEEMLYYKESEMLLNKAIEDLPPQQRIVFKMCKIDGKSYEEAAASLGISISTVSNHIGKATKKIKKVFFNSKSGFYILAFSLLIHKS